ncbi:MAG TPA: outer membrane beta-barrel protein [Vicinamibacterales bacterium]|nr:outer membrane beta-barrel protein [Vicinamibacterales bacterium]
MRTHTGNLIRTLLAAALVAALLPGTARAQDRSFSMSFLPGADSTAAQSSGGGGVGVGIKGGWLYNSLNLSGASDLYNSRSGWMLGIFFGGNRPGVVGVMGELNYLKKSATDKATGAVTNLYYLEIPVLLRINIGASSASGVRVYFIAGPGFDFKVGDSISSLAVVQNYETFDVNLIAGGGLEFARIILEARGSWGLRNIAVTQLNLGEDLKSRTFALLVGVRFN